MGRVTEECRDLIGKVNNIWTDTAKGKKKKNTREKKAFQKERNIPKAKTYMLTIIRTREVSMN